MVVVKPLTGFGEGMGGWDAPGRCWVLRVGRTSVVLGWPRFVSVSRIACGQYLVCCQQSGRPYSEGTERNLLTNRFPKDMYTLEQEG